MKRKMIIINIIGILVLPALLIACQKAPDMPSVTFTDTFTATYDFVEEGRSISVSGNSEGMPGERSEYILKISNGTEEWQDEYYVLLLDSDSVIQEISHKRFDIPGNGGIQEPIIVEFPEGFEGALGLCVLLPQGERLITTLSVGAKNAISTGWFDIHTYPISTNGGS
jgi:hypothetical protein